MAQQILIDVLTTFRFEYQRFAVDCHMSIHRIVMSYASLTALLPIATELNNCIQLLRILTAGVSLSRCQLPIVLQ
jgi:hypothetical protein